MLSDRIEILFDEKNICYGKIRHPRAFTAQEVAAAAHLPGKSVLKTVIVKLDGKMSMAVLPANAKVDLESLAQLAHADVANLASESEFSDFFPEAEVGAMPPLGNLYRMPVYMDDSVEQTEMIAFSAGSHNTLMQISSTDYLELVHPTVGHFSQGSH